MRDNAYAIAEEAMNQVESEPEPGEDVRIICMSDVVEKPISWLWPMRIACGKITVIAGDPGLGKSQLTANLAAIVSIGGLWPDYMGVAPAGDVVFLSAEDDPADTIKPRLLAAGADVGKCHIFEAILTKTADGKDSERSFNLSQDIERLSKILERMGNVRLVIIDPITAYLGRIDSHNTADMRGVLAPLAAIAAKHNVAILLVTHLNKSEGQAIHARVSGSGALVAAARAGYVVVKDHQNHTLRHFLPIKNNVGNDSDGFSYTIQGAFLPNGIPTSRIVWQPGIVNAQNILNPPLEKKPGTPDKAVEWLRTLLADKSMPASSVYAEAHGAGFTKYKITRAKEALGIEPYKQQGVPNGEWIWSLPNNGTEEIEGIEETAVLQSLNSCSFTQPPPSQSTQSSTSSIPSFGVFQK